MSKHIQGKDGKMAGSIGDGKINIPTVRSLPESVPSGMPSVKDYLEAQTAEIAILYDNYTNRAETPTAAPTSDLAADNEAQYCVQCEGKASPRSDEGLCAWCFDDKERNELEEESAEAAPYVPLASSPLDDAGFIRRVEEYPATPGEDGRTRTVQFTYRPDRAEVEADFILDGITVEHKYLTHMEYDVLSDAVYLEDVNGFEVSAATLLDCVENGPAVFDSEYGPTHFEDIFYEFMNGN